MQAVASAHRAEKGYVMTSLVSIYRRFPDRKAATLHLEGVRWPDGPICPYCASPKASANRDASRNLTDRRWQCQACGRSYSVTVGTIFHKSHVDLQRWFLLIALMLNAKKGLSSLQAARDLEMRQPTVWSMMQRVRDAMGRDEADMLTGLVEMDEAYVGGKPRKSNERDGGAPPAPRGRGTTKQPVVGAVERKGRMKARTVDPERMTHAEMMALAKAWIAPGAALHTDEYAGYSGMNRAYIHRRISHAARYVDHDLFDGQFGPIHTNTIESVWAILKRAVFGQFHHISRKHMDAYLAEITFRYNHRRAADPFGILLQRATNPVTV